MNLGTAFDSGTRFRGCRLHLGVSGSIACYKACDLLRAWKSLDIHVSATVTDGARQFVTPLLFEALGASPVYGRMFEQEGGCFDHLEPGQHVQAMIVAPASADMLARLAQGRASDMLSAQILAFDGPLLVAPAMNPRMWQNHATQANAALLKSRGAIVIEPGNGGTACGDEGKGRLAPLPEIFLQALRALSPQDLVGRNVMVTLGPTREAWDGVRFWSNPSSGRMGASLALAAWLRGAQVTAICGPGVQTYLPASLRRIDVASARDMLKAASDHWRRADWGLFCAAVADFAPTPPAGMGNGIKFKKDKASNGLTIEFTANPDILKTLAEKKRTGQKILAFAAETTPDMAGLRPLARAKLTRKKADLLAANRVNSAESGFGAPTNAMLVVDATGREEEWPTQDKSDVAWKLCSWLLTM